VRGHIRQRGKVWSFVIELGNQKTQRCVDCNKRHWVERRPYEKCERCGGELRDRVERRQREETGFRTRKEAEAALTTELGKIQTQTYIPASKITVREYLTDEWLPAVKGTVKPTTYLNYEIHIGRHINPVLGNIPLQKLSAPAINAFYARLLTEPRKPVEPLRPRKKPDEKAKLKPKKPAPKPQPSSEPEKLPEPLSRLSIRKIHGTLHKALVDAVRWNRITRNPADAADPPRTRAAMTHEMKTWSAKELQAFLVSTRDTRFYPLWLLLASTGMRRGDAWGSAGRTWTRRTPGSPSGRTWSRSATWSTSANRRTDGDGTSRWIRLRSRCSRLNTRSSWRSRCCGRGPGTWIADTSSDRRTDSPTTRTS
jgi:hypothetical protein